MTRQIAILRTATAVLSLLFTSLLNGQVQVLGQLYRNSIVNPGEVYYFEIPIINTSEKEVAVIMEKRDFYANLGLTEFPDSGSNIRSNSKWITTKHWQFLLQSKSKIVVKLKVSVPENVVGTHYSMVMVQVMNPKLVADKIIGIFVRHAILIISTVRGGKKDVEVVSQKFEDNKLKIKIKNVGDEVVILAVKPDLEEIKRKNVRIFPEMEQEVELDCSGLADGQYKFRVLLDDGISLIRPVFCEFYKGLRPEEVKYLPTAGERIAERKKARRRPVRVFVNLSYGSRSRGISLTGSAQFLRNFRFTTQSNFNEYYPTDYFFEGHRVTLGYKLKRLNMNIGTYFYNKTLMTFFSGGLNFRRTQVRINHLLERKTTNISLSQRIYKNYHIRGFITSSQHRKDWSLSLMIPII